MRKLILSLLLALHAWGATSLIVGTKGTATTASGATLYGMITNGNMMTAAAPTTESQAQFPIAIAGTFSMMRVKVLSNSLTATSTITFRKAAAGTYPQGASDGNETLTITSGQTGLINETTNGGSLHADHVNAGDYINFKFVVGGTGTSIALVAFEILFTPDDATKTLQKIGGFTSASFTSSNTNYFQPPAAFPGNVFNGVNEATAQLKIPTGGTLKNLCANVTANSFTSSGTVKSRVAGASGAQSATITANTGSTAEQYCDTGSGDSLSSGNLLDIAINPASTGSGSLTVVAFASDFITTDNTGFLVGQTNGNGAPMNANTTDYFPANGGVVGNTAQGIYQIDMLTTMTVGSFSAYVVSNTLTTDPALTFWKANTTASNLVITLTHAVSGWVDAPANSDSYAAGDLVEMRAVVGSGGTTVTVESTVAKLTYPATVSSGKIHHSVSGN